MFNFVRLEELISHILSHKSVIEIHTSTRTSYNILDTLLISLSEHILLSHLERLINGHKAVLNLSENISGEKEWGYSNSEDDFFNKIKELSPRMLIVDYSPHHIKEIYYCIHSQLSEKVRLDHAQKLYTSFNNNSIPVEVLVYKIFLDRNSGMEYIRENKSLIPYGSTTPHYVFTIDKEIVFKHKTDILKFSFGGDLC